MSSKMDRFKKQYRSIFEVLYTSPRVAYVNLGNILGIDWKTARSRYEEATNQQYIIGPELRKRSHKNLGEYVYFVDCKNAQLLYLMYKEDPRVIYQAKMKGFSDLLLITNEKIAILGNIMLEGYRSDYHVSFPPDHSWETALRIMEEKIMNFDPEVYAPQGIIKINLDRTIDWDEKDEFLYRYFKYNLRNPVTRGMEECHVSGEKMYEFLERLPETCTVFTSYYPDTLPEYDPYMYMFETDYEDFIIELFSEMPTTCSFFKVSDRLFLTFHVPKEIIRPTDLEITIKKLHIPLLIIDLSERGIVKTQDYAIIEHSKGKNL